MCCLEELLEWNSDKLMREEIMKAIMTLNNGKFAGPDDIPAEVLKADVNASIYKLYGIFEKIWDK